MYKPKLFIQQQLKSTLIRGFQKTQYLLSYLKNTWILLNNRIFDLARNPNTPPETLDRLANDEDADVRYWVAWNPHTLPETLESLANDDAWYVRCAVAWNPNTPQYIKDYLKIRQFLNWHNNNSI
jgi:hypothetical protein